MEYADGTSAVMVADTPWAIPWRATHELVEVYAKDRQAKGFNAALMMSVMPDRRMEGPRDRTQHAGFARGFEDLPSGHINKLNPEYFQYLDRTVEILTEHGIAPVWQPVFHGYGWRGLSVAGPVIPPDEYARYCRYLVARYGAHPAIWLVLGDGRGTEPGIDPGGREIEEWDAYPPTHRIALWPARPFRRSPSQGVARFPVEPDRAQRRASSGSACRALVPDAGQGGRERGADLRKHRNEGASGGMVARPRSMA